MEVKVNDFYLFCQYFNFSVVFLVDYLEEYNIICYLKNYIGRLIIMEDELSKEKLINYICRIMEYLNDCIYIFLYLEMDIKNIICFMKIIWYILVLLVFIFLIIFIICKIFEGQRRV